MENKPISNIDLNAFAGKWYSLYSIPTLMDKNWKQTTETYTLKDDDHFDVLTTYHKEGNPEEKSITSKLFFYDEKADGDMKAQFLWPFKIGYWIIELADDYSYVVVGHPDEKYLFIMARAPRMEADLLTDIIERCRVKGYDVSKLTSQEHF
ncbi:lipocalin family protein [Pedobacter sp. Leaf132]|uniref:lipocalin family protein n=1 Tax=Pedobacter sp. Leaf132 TaxID=2876557 RepID=UPI001E49BB76|nr:lipocalin family protein [Pedobacter sp. Leaf132]